VNFESNLQSIKREMIDETSKMEMGKYVWRQPGSCVGDLGSCRSRVKVKVKVKVKVEMVVLDRFRSRCGLRRRRTEGIEHCALSYDVTCKISLFNN